ncbi:MAG TPA: hypothetical protein VFE47_06850 [Tepidisphaeraceae bacterium]|jgi:hypothetical protein|nr:hypothetical protein [Tepidisphaeraceae bacterium]
MVSVAANTDSPVVSEPTANRRAAVRGEAAACFDDAGITPCGTFAALKLPINGWDCGRGMDELALGDVAMD